MRVARTLLPTGYFRTALLAALYTIGLILAPSPRSAHAVVVTITNTLTQEEEGSVLEIDSVKGLGVKPGHKLSIMPGEKKKVTPRNINAFVVSRVYGDYKVKYQVNCPTDRRVSDSIHLTLDQIINNKLPLGCEMTRTGKWYSSAGTFWDDDARLKNPVQTKALMNVGTVIDQER